MAHAKFNWQDPFLLDLQLTEDERMVREAGVAVIPLSSFFAAGTPDIYVRFAFCKQRSLLDEALKRLKAGFHG